MPKSNQSKNTSKSTITTDSYLTPENMQYCKTCKYKGTFSQNYLCSFNALTGSIRGCKPGVGCTKRVVENSDSTRNTETKSKTITRTCIMCGASYKGTKRSQYCTKCRHIASANHRYKKGE